jgi:hypothetical protein
MRSIVVWQEMTIWDQEIERINMNIKPGRFDRRNNVKKRGGVVD